MKLKNVGDIGFSFVASGYIHPCWMRGVLEIFYSLRANVPQLVSTRPIKGIQCHFWSLFNIKQ